MSLPIPTNDMKNEVIFKVYLQFRIFLINIYLFKLKLRAETNEKSQNFFRKYVYSSYFFRIRQYSYNVIEFYIVYIVFMGKVKLLFSILVLAQKFHTDFIREFFLDNANIQTSIFLCSDKICVRNSDKLSCDELK